MKNMAVIHNVRAGHFCTRFENSRDEDCRVLGVVMCVGANAALVTDMHVGLGLRLYPNVPLSPPIASQYLRQAQSRVSGASCLLKRESTHIHLVLPR